MRDLKKLRNEEDYYIVVREFVDERCNFYSITDKIKNR